MNDFHNHTLNQHEAEQALTEALTEETCWNDPSFVSYWEEVCKVVEDDHGIPDEGWMLETILHCYKCEGPTQDAIKEIREGDDPTPLTAYDFYH